MFSNPFVPELIYNLDETMPEKGDKKSESSTVICKKIVKTSTSVGDF